MKLRLTLFAVLAVGGICMPAHAAKLYEFVIQKFVVNAGVGEATLKLTNLTGHFIPRLDIRCEFKDGKGKTVDIGWRRYLRLAAGKTEYATVQGKKAMDTVRKVDCQVMSYQV
jgi:hypothetical protein